MIIEPGIYTKNNKYFSRVAFGTVLFFKRYQDLYRRFKTNEIIEGNL